MTEDKKGLFQLADRVVEGMAGEKEVELDRHFLKETLQIDLREHLPIEVYRMIYGLVSVFDRLEKGETGED